MNKRMRNEIIGWALLLALPVFAVSAAAAEQAPWVKTAMQMCHEDIVKFCSDVQPENKVLACLKAQMAKVSDGCASALQPKAGDK